MHLTENSKKCVVKKTFISETILLAYITEFSHVLRGCVKVHARQLIGERSHVYKPTHRRTWLRYSRILQAMQSSVGTSAKCIATMMHYLTISWVAPTRHKCYAFT